MQVVRDIYGREYRIESELAAGGEGVVARTDHPRVLVKLRPPDAAEPIDEVLRADLDGLSVCRPEALLQPPANGYVMHLVRDAEPLDRLRRPAHLSGAGLAPWYTETGGARRRLRALAGLATTIAALHGRGLCVADISSNNVLVPLDHAEVSPALIDPDNLHAPGDRDVRRFTRPYVAPEVFRGEAPCSMRSDVYALALLVVEILTLWFPLFGDAILAGPPEDEDVALRGDRAWIHDPADRSNVATAASPPELFLGEALARLAQRAFGSGRSDPSARPPAAAWARALHREADRSFRCSCSSWNLAHWSACMSCGRPKHVGVSLRIADSDETLPIADGGARLVRRHFITGCATPDSRVAEIALSLRPAGLRIERIGERPCTVLPGGELLPGVPVTVARGSPAQLDLGDRRAEVLWE